MNCPCCDEELLWIDSFGLFAAHQTGEKHGDIYKCANECCDEFDSFFHVYLCDGELRCGYPC